MSIKDEGKRASDKSRTPEKREPDVIRENAVRDPRVQEVIAFMNGYLHRRSRLTELAENANLVFPTFQELLLAGPPSFGVFPAQTLLSKGRQKRLPQCRQFIWWNDSKHP